MNGYLTPAGLRDVRARLGATLVQTATRDPRHAVDVLLPMARDAGVRVTLRMVGDHPRYTTSEGDFDLGAWKRMLEPWRGSGVDAFVADGTLIGHMLLDDIDTFAGRDPSGDDLEEMACFSHEVVPGLFTFVRQKASALPTPTGARYAHVDAVVNQYKAGEGDPDVYFAEQAARAEVVGVAVIHGLNIANGGDGSSARPGWAEGRWAMSGAEITRYAASWSASPVPRMVLAWEYDGEERWADGSVGSAWFDQPAQADALRALADHGARVP